ncbi:hypothetical protein CEPID_04555 [Corynebacterium epidermidicanis]|uniref:Uncharacterized protein n=1 Tax=Corynebacterium epidermidicanis TaxID=1050174 RepID=A0A0G3GVB8_9CORY|nr:hypothetical protein CEPID_04555 [Corynebacterium epidermidicanis]
MARRLVEPDEQWGHICDAASVRIVPKWPETLELAEKFNLHVVVLVGVARRFLRQHYLVM